MSVRRRAAEVFTTLALLAAAVFHTADAQQVRTAVEPDTITLGEVAHAAVRIDLPAGWWVVLPDSLELGEDLESAGPRSVRTETLEDRSRSITVAYPLTAWRPGSVELPALGLLTGGPAGERSVDVVFPALEVRSVLPAGADDPEPRPLKDVLGPDRTLWPLLLLGSLALLLGGAWLWRRARRRPAPAAPIPPPVPPREAALAALESARAAGFIESGRLKSFYSAIAEALREYLDALDHRWGAELTTSELGERLRADAPDGEIDELMRILAAADLVKFARRRAAPGETETDWRAARAWVERFEPVQATSDDALVADAMAGVAAGIGTAAGTEMEEGTS